MQNRRLICVSLVLLLFMAYSRASRAQRSVASALNDGHGNADQLKRADTLIEDAIKEHRCPGAVLLVGQGDDVFYRKACGNRAVEPARLPMEPDTIFDMASLTKAVATAPSIMILSDRGKLKVTDKVAKYIPAFAQNGKQDITIEQLLLHRGGLLPDDDIADYDHGPAQAWKNIYATRPESRPGTRFAYSDVGYIVLGKLVEVVSGRPLDEFAREEIYEPLGMKHTRFKPPPDWVEKCAPTEKREGHWMIGQVHDPRSYALGGVAGHAGLFSTADDLSRFCRMLLHGGRLDGHRVLKESTIREMTRERCLPDGSGCRGYGFDIDTPYSGCRGDRFAVGSTYGHTGFTGTSFWIDPVHQCYLVLLTNSVHPDGTGNILKLRHEVATVVAEALLGKEQPKTVQSSASKPESEAPVLCGIDVLEQQHFAPLHGKQIALVTNHTGIDATGNRTIDVLLAAKDVHLIKLFSPEHGLYGLVDEKVSDAIDKKTGLKVYSLYGKTEKPTPEMLAGVDAIVYDIQDVGARYYTYTTTLGLCMEAAAGHKIPIFVLDRPNPVTGLIVDGPVADENDLGFVCYAPIPVAHGMTDGELARMFNAERGIHCNLTVIPMQGWHRWMWWDDTSRLWVNPSPNIRNATQPLLYLGIGLLEATNVSVGRGTDQPFEVFGAPWIDARKLAAALNRADLPGLRFVPTAFTPSSSKFAKQACQGCYVEVLDRTAVEPVRAGLTIAWTLNHLFGKAFEINSVGNLLRNKDALTRLQSTDDPHTLPDSWRKPLEAFEQVREKYLIYR
jgi:uncharacterized protein YbbC (DUF1343 family)/CubicO group peptidase (beta-lactamase class C family)